MVSKLACMTGVNRHVVKVCNQNPKTINYFQGNPKNITTKPWCVELHAIKKATSLLFSCQSYNKRHNCDLENELDQ